MILPGSPEPDQISTTTPSKSLYWTSIVRFKRWWQAGSAWAIRGWWPRSWSRRAHARNRVDRRGYRVHLACAITGLIGLLVYDGAAEWLVVLPVLAALIRARATWRSMVDAIGRPVSGVVIAAGVWGLVALAWSSDVRNGLDELSSFRNALLVLALWPLRDHRGVLIMALAVGLALGNLTQIGHAIGVWGGVEWLRWPRLADRNSGWWDPVVGGSLLASGVGLHLGAVLRGRAKARIVGVLGLAGSIGGVLATGTRGAWVASSAVLVIGAIAACTRAVLGSRARSRRSMGAAFAVVGVLAVATVTAGLAAGPPVLERAGRGVSEVRRVLDERDFASDTGRRLLMWMESWRAVRSHPLEGVGTGGLGVWARDGARARGVDPALVLPHAHGMWIHAAGTQGIVGVSMWALVVIVAMCAGGVRVGRLGDPLSISPRTGWGSQDCGADRAWGLESAYATAAAWGLAGLVCAGVFDSVQLNSQTAMLMFALIALCAMGRRD